MAGIGIQLYDDSGTRVGNLPTISEYVSRTVTSGSDYYIKVMPNGANGGAYQIAFNTSTTATAITLPTTGVTQLTLDVWADGNISTYGAQWFKFTATAATQYIHFQLGALNDVYVQLYDATGAAVEPANLYGSALYTSLTVTSGNEYYIRVTPWDSNRSGAYKIGFTTSTTAPSS